MPMRKKGIQRDLSDKVFNYVPVVCNRVQSDRKKQHRKGSIYDYPACVAACCTTNDSSKIEVSESSNPVIGKTYKNPVLLHALMAIGKIGKQSKVTKCKNSIGHCAEPHVAELVLNKHSRCSMATLRFSKAIRPRTNAVIEYCDNCKYIFKL